MEWTQLASCMCATMKAMKSGLFPTHFKILKLYYQVCNAKCKTIRFNALCGLWSQLPSAQNQADREWPTTAAGINLEKQNREGRKGEKFPFGPPLPTRTEKPSKVERDDETQQRRHRQALHHIKGNIFKKHSHTEELLRHQQRNLHRAVWVNSLSFTQPFRPCRLSPRSPLSNNCTEYKWDFFFFETWILWNDTFLKWQNSCFLVFHP